MFPNSHRPFATPSNPSHLPSLHHPTMKHTPHPCSSVLNDGCKKVNKRTENDGNVREKNQTRAKKLESEHVETCTERIDQVLGASLGGCVMLFNLIFCMQLPDKRIPTTLRIPTGPLTHCNVPLEWTSSSSFDSRIYPGQAIDHCHEIIVSVCSGMEGSDDNEGWYTIRSCKHEQ